MLFGYPNVFATNALQLADDGHPELLETADVVMVREPWQMPHVINTTPADTPIVFSSHNVEIERFEDINRPAFDNRTMQRVRELEQAAVTKADAVVCTSERDANVYQKKYETKTPMIIAPNGTYEETIREHCPDSDAARRVRRRYGIDKEAIVCLFMGSDYQPNVEAGKVTIDIARELQTHSKPIHFLIMGSVGNSLDQHSMPPNVTITGYVEDEFEAHFDASNIALNPMLSGGGTNIKLFDYFARGLPVVSTRFGVRGINIRDGGHLKVADTETFPKIISTLSNAPETRKKLGQEGKRLTQTQYTWKISSERIRENLTSILSVHN
jgi:glycosyltransferase involved in cell wall biosynthesis